MKKSILLIMLLACSVLTKAQSSIIIYRYNGDPTAGFCCPNVAGIDLFMTNGCTGSWVTIPASAIPACENSTIINISAYCPTCTDIIAARVSLNPPFIPASITVGENTGPCGIYTATSGGSGGSCQWAASWIYTPGATTATLQIN